MRNPFATEPARFVCSPVLDYPSVHGQDDTEAVLAWTWLEALIGEICAYTTGRPSYPLLTSFSSLFLGVWHKLSDKHLAASLACHLFSDVSVALSYLEIFLTQRHWAVFAYDLFNTICVRSEASTYADAPYGSKETRETLARFSVANCVQRKG